MSVERCFLCAKTSNFSSEGFESIETCRMPASQKPIEKVLQHLANCVKTTLIFQSSASLCGACIKELTEYDNLMLKLLACQKKLTNQLQAILTMATKTDIEDDYDIDLKMSFEVEDQLADALNPDLDTKEELIEIDDNITEIVEEDRSSDDGDSNESNEWGSPSRRAKHNCVVCAKSFKSKVLLQNHVIESHNTKVHACNICGEVRRDEEYLELHMNIHEGKTENECRYCPKRFSRRVNTLRHMRKHWDKKKYQCEKCGERFSLDNMLYNHRLRHEAEENPVICSICNQSFKSRKTYNHHMLIHQENRPRHHCTLCAKSFTERYTLKMHMKVHKDAADVPAQELKETAEAVNMLMDSVLKEYSCVICNKKFDNKDFLEQHLQCSHDVILK